MMNRYLYVSTGWLIGLILFVCPIIGFAQLPPLQPEQDCINALPVCQSTYFQPNSYQGEGLDSTEIDPGPSCLNSGELNDVWYIFTVQTSGDVCFSIIPVDGTDDYDWAVYNLTNAPCSDIETDPTLEVSCNYAGGNSTCGGVTGPTGNLTGLCPSLNNPCIPVQAGETYVINVSNYSQTASGYTIDFSASTATVGDNTLPSLDSSSVSCNGEVTVHFSENVLCNTVEPADFLVENGSGTIFPVFGVNGGACLNGGTFEDGYTLNFASPLPNDTFFVTLVGNVTDNCSNVGTGGTDTFIVNVETLTLSTTADTICSGDSVFISASGLSSASYAWNVGGLTTSDIGIAPTTTTTYALTAISPAGCVFSASQEIVVQAQPIAAFTAPAQVCPDSPAVITFTGTTGPGSTYTWDFDTATVLSGTDVGPYSLEWPSGGIKTVRLSVENAEGCVSDTFEAFVNVPPVPTAVLDVPTQTCVGQPTQYGILPPVSATATYTWDQDGQTILSGSGAGPYEVTWGSPGVEDICLVVEESGCPSPVICTQIVVNDLPDASMGTVDNQCLSENLYQFVYAGTSTITDYLWDFDDNGITTSIANPPYTYLTAGLKTVVLTVVDGNGCQNQDSVTFEVYPEANAAFTFDVVCEGNPTPFTDQSTSDGTLANWTWSFGDGAVDVSQNPTYSYGQDSVYEVQLLVATADGCVDSVSQLVEVYDTPNASFTYDLTCEAQATQLTNASTFDNEEVSYTYLFPNGETQTIEDPFFTFPDAGPQPVSLTVVNSDGCSDTYTVNVEVFSVPQAAFSGPDACDGTPMVLSNTSIVDAGDSIVGLVWTLSDGTVYDNNLPSVDHLFPEADRYYVELLVTSLAGCQDSVADSVYVWGNPFVEFEADPACAQTGISFENRSGTAFELGGTLVSHDWSFGDGAVANGPSPVHTYAQGGDYEVILTVTTDKGCTATGARRMEVFYVPAAPTPIGDTVCRGDEALLTAALTANADQIAWFDEATGTPVFLGTEFSTMPLEQNETYYASAVTEQGCESERIPILARIHPDMQGEILQSATEVEMPDAVVSFSVVGNFNGAVYDWDFGERSTSSEASPTHQYLEAGPHDIAVTVISDVGCELTLNAMVEVIRQSSAFVPNAFSPNEDGINDEFYIGAYNLAQMEFVIYNQWGQIVYETDNPDFRWDGLSRQGRPVPEGTYVYRLSGVDVHGSEVTRTGTLIVAR